MQQALRRYFAALAVLWVCLSIAAYFYSDSKNIPWNIAVSVLPAFLLEVSLYAACGVPQLREALGRVRRPWAATLVAISAVLPYVVYSVAAGLFSWQTLGLLTALACSGAFWFVLLPATGVFDALYVLLLAAPILLKVFPFLYEDPAPKLQMFTLGVVMWYRTSLLSILVIRKLEGVGFGFLPHRQEWWIGCRNFLIFLPFGFGLGYSLNFIRVRDQQLTWQIGLMAIATFLGVLWVLAVAEEFFFRGYLQQLLSKACHSERAGLLGASLVFGAAHLGFRNQFPNWPFAALATIAGIFYGVSFQQARSIRAGMVTHAFVVTVWRTFLV